MAMFDLKDSEDINLTGCHTDSQELVRGEGLKRLDVADSSAFASQPDSPLSPKPSVRQVLAQHILASFFGLLVALIAGYLLWRFGWTS